MRPMLDSFGLSGEQNECGDSLGEKPDLHVPTITELADLRCRLHRRKI